MHLENQVQMLKEKKKYTVIELEQRFGGLWNVNEDSNGSEVEEKDTDIVRGSFCLPSFLVFRHTSTLPR